MSNLVIPQSNEIKKFECRSFVRLENLTEFLNKASLEKGSVVIESLTTTGYQHIVVISWIEKLNVGS